MEPVIAVFTSRNSAEQAVNELLKQDVPKQAVAVLTAAKEQSRIVAGQLGTCVGILAGFGAGMSLGVAIALQLGMAQGIAFLVMGFGTAALVGISGGVIGRVVCSWAVEPEDKVVANGFQRGHALVIVSTESEQIASCAQRVLTQSASAYAGS
ncbi:MAG TPA: general stress protein [Terriglobales bacterium]|nr:general stress protein [Terriglobales bacterium]